MTANTDDGKKSLIHGIVADSGLDALPAEAFEQLATFLGLFERWNRRLNLSAIREAEQIIRRHFVESIFAAQHLPSEVSTLLDFGSGGGFPGIPMGICRPEVQITLSEAHARKASFLRESVRILGGRFEVFDDRVEKMEADRLFDAVTMRAVEKMKAAIPIACARAKGCLLLLATESSASGFCAAAPEMRWNDPLPMPNSRQMVLLLGSREQVTAP